MRSDPVSHELRTAVIRADLGRCVAPVIDPDAGACQGRLTLDHVKDQPMMGKRAPSDARHLATLCERHHLWSRWATSHRPELRHYLATHR